MTTKQSELYAWLETAATACEARRKALEADDRADEAVFEKISGNVYEIFRSVLSAAEKTCRGEEAIGAFFREKAVQIPANWARAYAAAKDHGDADRMHIESLKLDATQQIRDAFSTIWEENT